MKKCNIKWKLLAYDMVILLATELVCHGTGGALPWRSAALHSAITLVCVLGARLLGNIYRQIWRYGGIQCYVRLLAVDMLAFFVNLAVELLLPLFYGIGRAPFSQMLSVASMSLLGAMAIRMVYLYAYRCGNSDARYGKFFRMLLRIFADSGIEQENQDVENRTRVAIIGVGRVGATLAEELFSNPAAARLPCCFVDIGQEKVGREIQGLPVLAEDDTTLEKLRRLGVKEVVFAIPDLPDESKRTLYSTYAQAGFKIKVYDYPVMQTAGKKRYLRDYDMEELLFRKPIVISNEKTSAYYRNKVVLITGGGGSIGSELCRQLAKMKPKRIIILDIYENGAYDVQQELKIAYPGELDLQIEICSITNKAAMARVFETYRPQVVINAAAHKHVPLMEHNCIEAVENNVFGTKNLVELCEEFGAERFMMVSTDKAVNPTNVMGATKRMCEMIVQSASTWGKTTYSTTRFGNVLGSAGSVIPLFKRQIANGGPITLTDKRVIRYFMTIPEASQLVLQSGAMAKNGELFVLDMGRPVKILDLAENMIRLSGASGIEIEEVGLRPGEKLYEELLVNTEKLTKTENSLIFIEKDRPLSQKAIDMRLELLKSACATGEDEAVRAALKKAVLTYKAPEEINAEAEQAAEMQLQEMYAGVSGIPQGAC